MELSNFQETLEGFVNAFRKFSYPNCLVQNLGVKSFSACGDLSQKV